MKMISDLDYTTTDGQHTYYNSSMLDNVEPLAGFYSSNITLHQAIDTLSSEQPFINFALPLSTDDFNLLNQLQIISTQEYHNFGKLENLNDEIKTFLESLAEKNSKISDSASTLITTLVKDIVSSSKQGDSAWVLVRAYIDNNQHDLPNWHTDPCLGLLNCIANEHVIVFSLKGPSTLFYPIDTEEREEFNLKSNIENYLNFTDTDTDIELQQRKELAKMINVFNAISANYGEGTVFLSGETFGAVHSVPPIHEERLFVAVAPSSKLVIQQLEDRIKKANEE
jgi:hypothetical protein